MNLHMIVGAAAAALTLSSGLALAQTPSAATAQYGQASLSNAAFVGSGSNPGYEQHQQQLQHEPGYGVGGNG
jgi:hypothetical protein